MSYQNKTQTKHLHTQDWDTTTCEWFSNDKEADIALPEYRLTFLWLDKTLACGVDQVRALYFYIQGKESSGVGMVVVCSLRV